jgi:hypothetical protein
MFSFLIFLLAGTTAYQYDSDDDGGESEDEFTDPRQDHEKIGHSAGFPAILVIFSLGCFSFLREFSGRVDRAVRVANVMQVYASLVERTKPSANGGLPRCA